MNGRVGAFIRLFFHDILNSSHIAIVDNEENKSRKKKGKMNKSIEQFLCVFLPFASVCRFLWLAVEMSGFAFLHPLYTHESIHLFGRSL
jgi:hypothetical protein